MSIDWTSVKIEYPDLDRWCLLKLSSGGFSAACFEYSCNGAFWGDGNGEKVEKGNNVEYWVYLEDILKQCGLT